MQKKHIWMIFTATGENSARKMLYTDAKLDSSSDGVQIAINC